MDDEKQAHINENNDSNNVPDTENMSPTELRQALRKIGIKTCVRNVKRLQEMFQDAVQNAHEAQAAQSYPVLLITLYLYINSILKIIRKSCVINLLRYIFI
jgi:hypothetical protein